MSRKEDVEEKAATSLVNRVYYEIREAIIDGTYAAGSALKFQEVALALGVSLSPVREALRKLEAERLVLSIPNKGVRVAELSLEDLQDSYQMRTLLEARAIREAHPNLSEEDIAVARDLIDRMVTAFDVDARLSADLHHDLHFLIYDRAHSEWLSYLIGILWAHTERYRRLGTPRPSGGDLGGQHIRMLDALAEGRIEAAVEALRLDLEETADRAMHHFTASNSAEPPEGRRHTTSDNI